MNANDGVLFMLSKLMNKPDKYEVIAELSCFRLDHERVAYFTEQL